jgi:hypothetical protein
MPDSESKGYRLSEAMESNDMERFRAILENEYDAADKVGACQHNMVFAAMNGQLEFVEYLVSQGADLNYVGDGIFSSSALDLAASNGHETIVDFCLSNGSSANREIDGDKYSSGLISAAKEGYLSIAKMLVEAGANINTYMGDATPLSLALAWDNHELADYLKSRGAKMPREVYSPPPMPVKGRKMILAHFEEHRGPVTPIEWQPAAPTPVPFAVHTAGPGGEDETDYRTLFTLGLFNKAVKFPNGQDGYYELFLKLPSAWPLEAAALQETRHQWPLQCLARVAVELHTAQHWSIEPKVFDFVQSLEPAINFCGVMVIEEPGEFGSIYLPDIRSVQFLAVYPLYADEVAFAIQKGPQALIKRFRKAKKPMVLAPNRKSALVS